jgi:hypothetical protein
MIKTGENQTEAKENDSIQESKTKATTHVATANVIKQLHGHCFGKTRNLIKTFCNCVTAGTTDHTFETLLRWFVTDFEISC